MRKGGRKFQKFDSDLLNFSYSEKPKRKSFTYTDSMTSRLRATYLMITPFTFPIFHKVLRASSSRCESIAELGERRLHSDQKEQHTVSHLSRAWPRSDAPLSHLMRPYLLCPLPPTLHEPEQEKPEVPGMPLFLLSSDQTRVFWPLFFPRRRKNGSIAHVEMQARRHPFLING